MINAKILLVDDEINILKTLVRLLRNEPYQLLTANSGKQGLEILKENHIHMVISDMRMPHMNGADFLQKVEQEYPDIIKIIMSGYADLNSLVDAVNMADISYIISKPWDNDRFKDTVKQVLQSYRNKDNVNILKLKNRLVEQRNEISRLLRRDR